MATRTQSTTAIPIAVKLPLLTALNRLFRVIMVQCRVME
jgi:hypothetical protein